MASLFSWLRPKPPSDIAQAIVALMDDPARWSVEGKGLRHTETDLIVRLDWDRAAAEHWPLTGEIGGEEFAFKEADFGAVWKAYRRLRPRVEKREEALLKERLRAKLALPSDPAALPAPPAEPLEVVEERVRRLREAVLASSPAGV